ncbi:hypothetical protein [Sphingosinicella sp. BN140058]|uniref:hypothetical protein n=1 Tax=Sphingosinicella sp. BN140058 TaxID=1892855 RepID=UPI001010F6AC|nr:hypothetical protein [Sphingosinicella sp. BN140058]QAY76024.1 hypothetical protein ETR14_05395 [Sphingosinicella sp. BN140058]
MSSFLFSRQPPKDQPATQKRHNGVPPQQDVAAALRGMIEVQSITTSAIFAMLVSKGVLTSEEAAGYMAQIAGVLERDVAAPAGPQAGAMLDRYGQALVAAGD